MFLHVHGNGFTAISSEMNSPTRRSQMKTNNAGENRKGSKIGRDWLGENWFSSCSVPKPFLCVFLRCQVDLKIRRDEISQRNCRYPLIYALSAKKIADLLIHGNQPVETNNAIWLIDDCNSNCLGAERRGRFCQRTRRRRGMETVRKRNVSRSHRQLFTDNTRN
jgi:hypothetical protein